MKKFTLKTLPSAIAQYLLSHVQIQLFITLISLPILMMWGIPLSYAAVIGNIIFAPLMALFLIFSSLIFISELCTIPNGVAVFLLEKITALLCTCLHYGSKNWLVGFAKPPLVVLLLIPLVTLALLIHPLCSSTLRRIGALSSIFVFIFIYGYIIAPQPLLQGTYPIPFSDNKLLITHHEDASCTLVDNGCFNTKPSPENFINFELKPYLIQNSGMPLVREIKLLKPSLRSLKATVELCSTLCVKSVVIKQRASLFTKRLWRLFYQIKEMVEERITFVA